MRKLSAPAALLALTLTACSTDPANDYISPSSPDFARGAHVEPGTTSRHIRGTMEATETGVPQPGTPIVERRLEGEGTASHLGRFTTVADIRLNLATASGTGTVTYTAANGDMLSGTSVGQAVLGAGTATVTETVSITGGTGRFAGATGSLTVVRRIVQATGFSTGTIDGTITLPK